ncbi:Hemerythrin HHE cation binding domain-containing protein [Nocardioides scoriae]|uniref:Hemerythrin HHE cation binding domain-containing protein n=2 Tax=Nocardioides scoriae TaxID=642780 RepID=A0A1H1T2T8_9ACTN|nr:Hemerythrin HHE cation binding domain-containing protein [Nocardioides scoriae]
MSMNTVIHAAVRRDLGRLERALDDLAPGDTARAAELARAWAHFREQLDHHHRSEHEVVWPALTSWGVDPALLAQMDAEHDLMAAALADADAAVGTLRGDASPRSRDHAREAVRRLHRVTADHLEHEERELEPLLLGGFEGSPEAAEMDRRLRAGGLGRAAVLMSWLADGAGPRESQALRELVPAPFRVLLIGVMGRGYRREVASVWR